MFWHERTLAMSIHFFVYSTLHVRALLIGIGKRGFEKKLPKFSLVSADSRIGVYVGCPDPAFFQQ
jgi:hypothetical protein